VASFLLVSDLGDKAATLSVFSLPKVLIHEDSTGNTGLSLPHDTSLPLSRTESRFSNSNSLRVVSFSAGKIDWAICGTIPRDGNLHRMLDEDTGEVERLLAVDNLVGNLCSFRCKETGDVDLCSFRCEDTSDVDLLRTVFVSVNRHPADRLESSMPESPCNSKENSLCFFVAEAPADGVYSRCKSSF
jgi:hypothetical protein